MSPAAHLFASWIIAAKTTNNPRDCRLVTLAGLLPDLDGLGLVADVLGRCFGHQTFYYQRYHHILLHGAFGAALIVGLLVCFARDRRRVALVALVVFHLHLLCDLIASRGPSPSDLWPIPYLAPFSSHLIWVWKGQWRLDGWQNRLISLTLFAWTIRIALRQGHSFVGVFHRRTDEIFVGVLRKWRSDLSAAMQQPGWLHRLTRPPWRTLAPAILLPAMLAGVYAVWDPGLDVRDGRHDVLRNGIWLGHGWLGADQWFVQNGRTNEFNRFRDSESLRELSARLRLHHIRDVFPHLCPADAAGSLPPVDDSQAEALLSALDGLRVMPWVGGPNGSSVHCENVRWRTAFIASITNLLATHPRLAGIHLNVEPLESGDTNFLQLLTELRVALPRNKALSVAAYPPPTIWHRHSNVHWDEDYFRQVAKRCDQIVVMMYDTALRTPKLYRNLISDWTDEVLAWSGGKPVLLGIPTYADAGVEYHDPAVENLSNALLGIHQALSLDSPPSNYQGIAIYCEWETDEGEWQFLRERFLRP